MDYSDAMQKDKGFFDGFVKSPDAALRFTPRRCGVRQSTPPLLGIREPYLQAYYEASPNSRFSTFDEVIFRGCVSFDFPLRCG